MAATPPPPPDDVPDQGSDEDEWVEVEWVDAPGDELLYDDDDGVDEDDDEPVAYVYEATIGPGDERAAEVLRRGEVEVLGSMPWSSNATFLVRVSCGSDHLPAIYKPERGERPLWDFPGGLWKREVAASVLSDHLGLGLVPPTVRHELAPLGVGSIQAFVPARFADHYFTIRDRDDLAPVLKALCAFDLVANSADRKGGHCLIDDDDGIWAIDNGLSFHREFKVRTVIWDFAGEAVPDPVLRALDEMLGAPLPDELTTLLDRDERDALRDRAGAVLASGRFPHDPTGRRVPWPLV